MNPPFRAEHIGSLLRPKPLRDARAAGAGPQELRALEDEAVREMICWQEALGLACVTDGELRRESWRLGFVSKVAGFARADAVGDVDLQRDDSGISARVGSAPVAVAKVRRIGPVVADEVGFARRQTKRTVKATLPAPSYLHYPRGRACVDPRVYPDLDEFFEDVVRVYVEELAALAAEGGRYVQFDEVAQALLCDQAIRDAVSARGDDPDALLELYIGLINRIAAQRPPGMTIGVHMCRGNALGRWIAAGGYERIAERAFGALEVDALFLEYDSARAGGFEPLRFVPKDRCVVLGLVSTKTPVLESKDELKRRVDLASRYFPRERLAISPQCGFASHHRGSALAFADQEAKLRRVVETASEIWAER